jgi:hypothetical protein
MKELKDIQKSAAIKSGVFTCELANDNLFEWDVKLKQFDPESKPVTICGPAQTSLSSFDFPLVLVCVRFVIFSAHASHRSLWAFLSGFVCVCKSVVFLVSIRRLPFKVAVLGHMFIRASSVTH